ncbi:hypothetical protein BT69DRAFT_1300991, partial [Atractiella rhizophila]
VTVKAGARSLPIKLLNVQPGSFVPNFLDWYTARKQDDGSCLLSFPAEPHAKFTIIDIREDYGKYVAAALEKDVDTVYPAPGWITPVDMARDFEKFSGRKFTFQKMHSIAGGTGNAAVAKDVVAIHRAIREIGYIEHLKQILAGKALG